MQRAQDRAPSLVASDLQEPVDSDAFAHLTNAASGLEVRREWYTPHGLPPVELKFLLKPTASVRPQRIVDVTRSALQLYGDWFGAYPYRQLTVMDASWRSGLSGAAYPGVVVTSSRWIAPARDRALERSLIGAIGRQYWFGAPGDATEKWLQEGLSLYSGTRAIHETLERANPETVRHFNGFFPYTIRSVPLTPSRSDPRPRVRHFTEIDEPAAPWRAWTAAADGEAQRAALALHTLERYIGWPALQQALSAFRQRSRDRHLPADLNAAVTEQRGRNFSWFFDEAFRFEARFDYAVDRMSSERWPDDPTKYQTTIGLRRLGDGVFAGTSEPRAGPYGAGRGLQVAVRFDDGAVVRDWWDGREAAKELTYVSTSPAASASVDPDAVLLLDVDRTNNTQTLRPRFRPIGARLALHWVIWLQDLLLSYSALA